MEQNSISIALIQSELHWQNTKQNLQMFEQKIASIIQPVDLIVLPEMFTTGFSMEVELLAENWFNSPTLEWIKNQSKLKNATICGSFMVEENGSYYNRLVCINAEGEVQKYDKRHLFRMAKEHQYFSEGSYKLIIEINNWKICPMVCYDLRFPVWSRNKNLEYDILLFVANWPEKRIAAWDTLLKARSIENLCYSIGVNRTGNDGNNIQYCGNSAVYDFLGNEIYLKNKEEDITIVQLSKSELDNYRERFPAHLDADFFHLST